MKKYNIIILACFLIGLFLFGCKKMPGDYKEYLAKAEGVYPGKPKSLRVLQGINRANISLMMSPDPRVVKVKLYWNSRRDSIETPITAANIAKEKIIIIPSIAEGVYTFEAVTCDAAGRRSIPLEKTASVLGANYLSGLFNRVVKARITVEEQPAVSWYSETDTSSIMVGIRVSYPLKDGGTAVVFTKKSRDTTLLTHALPLGKMMIKTAYLPKLAIDTFYSKQDTLAY